MTLDGIVVLLIWAVAILGLVVFWHLVSDYYKDR